jgi:phage terminase large subunit-like protein
VWSLNSGDIDNEVFLNNQVYVGLDLSSKNDLTAMVLIAFDEKWHIKPYFWTPKDGLIDRSKRDRAGYDTWAQMGLISPIGTASLDYEILAIEIAEILEPLDVVQVAFDRWRIDLLKKEFDRIGANLPLVEFGQGYKDISPAIESLEGLLLNGKMLHGNNPVLKMCAANSKIIMDPAGNRKLDKQKSTGRIDGMVALAMAVGVMPQDKAVESNYNKRGIIFI